jgi:GntR family transcriptional regulator, galactonate operon transcriptional repressor
MATESASSQRGLHGQLLRHHALAILRGELKPGDLIPDRLPAGLRASRTAQREAIRVLSAKGLVESRQRVGTRVRPREDWNLLDPDVLAWLSSGKPDQRLLASLVEVRALIEPFAAALAATRASKAEIQTLRDTFAEMEQTLDVDRDAFIDADMRFHDAILAASKNELLRSMCSAISNISVRSRQVSSGVPGANRASMPIHRKVVEGIAARKPEAAAAAMRKLVAEHGRDISGSH